MDRLTNTTPQSLPLHRPAGPRLVKAARSRRRDALAAYFWTWFGFRDWGLQRDRWGQGAERSTSAHDEAVQLSAEKRFAALCGYRGR